MFWVCKAEQFIPSYIPRSVDIQPEGGFTLQRLGQCLPTFGQSINQSINQYLFTTISGTLHNYIYILTRSNKSMIQIQYNMEMLPGVIRQRVPFKCMGFWYICSRISAAEKTRLFGVNRPLRCISIRRDTINLCNKNKTTTIIMNESFHTTSVNDKWQT